MNKIFHSFSIFLKKLLGKQEESCNVTNPWAGLSSYEDPIKVNNPLKFCGREDESSEVFRLIDDNIVITLYGKSGIGKTSLLNAGVFPILRDNNYYPLYVRFASNSGDRQSFASQIINILTSQINEIYGTDSIKIVDVIPENTNPESENYLWSFFARRRFVDATGNTIFPVIVLDQFEENIRINRQQVTLLLKQIAYMSNRQNMLKETMVNDQYYIYDYNYRFVISIREDDLYRLEDIININYLSSLRNGRYRLQNLNENSATSIVANVGGEYIYSDDIDTISRRIIEIATDKEDGLIQTNVISLVCSRLFDLISNNGKSKITLKDVDNYLSTNPFDEYYTASVKKLSEGEKRFIETNLISADGRRNMLPETSVKSSIKSYDRLINGKTAILHRIRVPLGENLVELIHDGLCSIVLRHRMIRLEKKNKTILSLCLFMFGLLAIWMLNAAVVNDFVKFFLKISNWENINSLKYTDVLAVAELIFIFICPIAIGSVVYDYVKKNNIAMLVLLFFLFPCILYPQSFISFINEIISIVVSNYKEYGISSSMSRLSSSVSVFLCYSIATLFLWCINNFGKSGVKQHTNLFKILYSNLSVRVYLLVIAGFLFYKSIFNNGHFVVESYDSCWGLIIIPILALNLFRINFFTKRHRIALCLYSLLLVGLMICSIMEVFLPLTFQTSCLILSLFFLVAIYYEGNLPVAILKSALNVVILAIVMLLQIGYSPFELNNQTIQKVYPWKIVVAGDINQFGVYDALYGDTLLVPGFKRYSKSLTYYKIITKSDYTDSIKADSVGYYSLPFPLKLNKIGPSKWKLSLMYSPDYEHAISRLAHSEAKDSIMRANIEGATLFTKLRNDISMFCISGNDSILLSDVSHIRSYEKVIKHNLDNSLCRLYANDSVMTENDIVPFIKALSRSFYLNMLKESILKRHYNDYIGWYSSYYMATSLTSITSKNGIPWSNTLNYKWDLSLKSDSNSSSSIRQSDGFTITLDELNDNKVYAWNNLFYTFFLLECNAYLPTYCINIKNKLQQDKLILNKILNNAVEMANILTSYYSELQKQHKDLNKTLEYLTNLNKRDERLSLDDVSKIIKNVIDARNTLITVGKNMPTKINSFNEDMIALSDTIRTIELYQADMQFEDLVIGTFNSLIKTINKNPINAYNGLLISLCQELYTIGVIRGYDMKKLDKQIYHIEKLGGMPIYDSIKQISMNLEDGSQMIDSIRKQFDLIRLKANSHIEQNTN